VEAKAEKVRVAETEGRRKTKVGMK